LVKHIEFDAARDELDVVMLGAFFLKEGVCTGEDVVDVVEDIFFHLASVFGCPAKSNEFIDYVVDGFFKFDIFQKEEREGAVGKKEYLVVIFESGEGFVQHEFGV
jgi:hypothetical protein